MASSTVMAELGRGAKWAESRRRVAVWGEGMPPLGQAQFIAEGEGVQIQPQRRRAGAVLDLINLGT